MSHTWPFPTTAGGFKETFNLDGTTLHGNLRGSLQSLYANIQQLTNDLKQTNTAINQLWETITNRSTPLTRIRQERELNEWVTDLMAQLPPQAEKTPIYLLLDHRGTTTNPKNRKQYPTQQNLVAKEPNYKDSSYV